MSARAAGSTALALWIALVGLSLPRVVAPQGAARRQELLQVRYSDGRQVSLHIEWRVNLGVERSETGGPPNVARFKLTDDRRCEWTIRGEVQRLLSNADGSPVEGALNDVIPVDGGTVKKELRGEECGDSLKRFEEDANAVRAKIEAALPAITNRDLETVKRLLGQQRNVSRVEVLPKAAVKPGDDTQKEIQEALNKYKRALEERDPQAFRSVYPDLPKAQFDRVSDSFQRTRERTVELKVDSISVFGSTAEAKGRRKDFFVTTDGQQFRNEGPFVFKLNLRKEGWVIVAAY